jgi:peroxiredoxin
MARSDNLYALPPDLPVPVDDGACDHLAGSSLPQLAMPSTGGGVVVLPQVDSEWLVVYCYPRTGLPDQDPPGGLAAWDAIPGARGCTPQACSYRDHHAGLVRLGATVYGVSTQETAYQQEVVRRLHLPYDLLSDANLEFSRSLRLPTFTVADCTVIKRLTFIARNGRIEKAFYPVFPPDADAPRILRFLASGKTNT